MLFSQMCTIWIFFLVIIIIMIIIFIETITIWFISVMITMCCMQREGILLHCCWHSQQIFILFFFSLVCDKGEMPFFFSSSKSVCVCACWNCNRIYLLVLFFIFIVLNIFVLFLQYHNKCQLFICMACGRWHQLLSIAHPGQQWLSPVVLYLYMQHHMLLVAQFCCC